VQSAHGLSGPLRTQIEALLDRQRMRCLAIADGDNLYRHAPDQHVLQQAACTEDLVIGVRGYDDHTTRLQLLEWLQLAQPGRAPPPVFRGPKAMLIDH
jgi:hypothetical protein